MSRYKALSPEHAAAYKKYVRSAKGCSNEVDAIENTPYWSWRFKVSLTSKPSPPITSRGFPSIETRN